MREIEILNVLDEESLTGVSFQLRERYGIWGFLPYTLSRYCGRDISVQTKSWYLKLMQVHESLSKLNDSCCFLNYPYIVVLR